MAVNPSVARGDGTYADPGTGRACCVGEQPVVVETRGRGDGTPGVDWTYVILEGRSRNTRNY